MRFSCDSCGKKYATADDPAPGRVYKIKCKACGHLIVVKASAGGAPAVPHHEPPAAPSPTPSSEIPLEIGAPEREAPPVTWPEERRARGGEPTAHVEMPAPDEPPPPPPASPGDGAGYVDLFGTEASALPGATPSLDPFSSSPPLDDFGAGASSLPDPFAPVREVKAHETVTPEPPPMPKVPVIPKPAQQRSIVPIALAGGGVALLLGIVGFVVVSRGGGDATAAAAPPPQKPVVAAAAEPPPPPEPAAVAAEPEPEAKPAPAEAAAEGRKAAEERRRLDREEAAERERLAREEKARLAAEAKERARVAAAEKARTTADARERARAERAERDRLAREEKARLAAEAKERARLAAEERARAAAAAKERARLAAEEKAARLAREREERIAREAAAREDRERDDRVAMAAEAEQAQSLTQSQIEGVLRASKPSFDSCMRSASGGDVKLDGRRIMLRLNIQPSGTVTYPTIDDVVVNGADLGTCLKSAARSMLFPKFSGDTMHVEVPIALR